MTKPRSELLSSLSPEQRDRLLKTLKQGAAGVRTAIPRRAAGAEPLPVSPAQNRLWLFEQVRPGSAAYTECSALALDGELDVAGLDGAIADIVHRHEALRTTFRTVDGAPTQVVGPAPDRVLAVRDLAALAPAERTAEVERVAAAEAARPFDLAAGPLLRATLLRLEPRRHVLLVTAHHIVLDGWSIAVFQRELAQHYNARRTRGAVDLPALPIQYADYAAWQRGWLGGDRHRASVAYWRQQLAGLPPVLELPFARPRPELESLRGASQPLRLDRELCAALARLARAEGTTLFTVLLAGFQALLQRYTGRRDIAVGTVVANRGVPEIEPLIGFFVNTLVLRSDVDGAASFRRLIRQVHDTSAAAQDHQECPFEDVVDALQPERTLAHNPLFQIMFILQNTPRHPLALHGVTAAPLALPVTAARYDLTLSLDEADGECAGHWEYSTDLFDADSIARMTGHLATLLRELAAHPDRPIEEAALVTAAEHRQIVDQWNPPAPAALAPEAFVHRVFQAQAARTPDAIAIAQGERTVSYRELDLRAGAIAGELRALGIGPGALVGVFARRSPDMIAALLGVLEAGAAYLPLDPSYPTARLAYMLDNAGAAAVVAQRALVGELPAYAGPVAVIDDEAAPAAAPPAIARSGRAPGPHHPAYAIYTSGSSGDAKGVLVSHANLAHSTLARAEHYRAPVTGFLLTSSFSFDSSVAGMFWTLTQGGALVLPEGEVLDVARLCGDIARRAVSHVLCIPSVYELLLERAAPGQLGSLRAAIVAGEACPADLPRRHRAAAPEARLFNEYGPTEATVWSTVADITDAAPDEPVPIGRATPRSRCYVLDPAGQLVPIGVPGELCVGGPGVALGYHAAPELTAARFAPDRLARAPGARLYRTGDQVRYRVDGALEFLGRLDDQVKLRGVRIQLGEVEAVLLRHGAVREAIAAVRGDGDHRRLIGYVVADPAALPTTTELREFAARQLPSAAVPADIVVLDDLPRLPNGKVDRRALPTPGPRPAAAADLRGAAEWTALERALGAIWCETLQLGAVGLDDDFFQIGGDSLSAIRVFNRLHEVGPTQLSITDLFKHRTIRALVAAIEAGG